MSGIFQTLKRNVEQNIFRRNRFDKEWIDSVDEKTKYTPDIWHLDRYTTIPLFVYGEEQSRHEKNSDMLGWYVPKTVAFTTENFTMWKHVLGKESYPIVMNNNLPFENYNWFNIRHGKLPMAKIRGEIYHVDQESIIELDNYRQNGLKFERVLTQVIVPHRDPRYTGFLHLKDMKAYMYIGKESYWEDQILMGAKNPTPRFRRVRSFENKRAYAKPYYYYTFTEYLE